MENTITNKTRTVAWKNERDISSMAIIKFLPSDEGAILYKAGSGEGRRISMQCSLLSGENASNSVVFTSDNKKGDFALLIASAESQLLDNGNVALGFSSKANGEFQAVLEMPEEQFNEKYTTTLPEFSSKEVSMALSQRTRELANERSASMGLG